MVGIVSMKIAVASQDGETVAGHIGKCKGWMVFEVQADSESPSLSKQPSESSFQLNLIERIVLPKTLVFHHYKDDRPHPLADCDVVIGASAGESFVTKMARRGISAVLTAETNPAKAAMDFIQQQVIPPKPRPIGGLVCKIKDALS